MDTRKKYYITTPIYYPSGKWHIGHSYTTVCCDAMARYKRMKGFDVFYLTGTDEHGQKIEKKAAEAGQSPKKFVDSLADSIQKLWKLMDISYDKFIRTTDPYHEKAVQKIFKRLYDSGDIYKSKYKGKYCIPCESFWTQTQSKNGVCPDCGREVIDSEEECYFFRLSKYQDKIRQLLTKTEYLQPQSRVNEMVNNFLNEGLEDLAVSRTSLNWGVKVDFDPKHAVYVWIDALSNYITALGAFSEDESLLNKYWPADLHMMAKEIVRFHAIIWPAILMALGMQPAKKVFGHGWILFDGAKMSKSVGNIVDPFILCERYGVDAIRYYLLREISFGFDCDYSSENLLNRINMDLVNDYGNLVKRTIAMSGQYFDGNVQKGSQSTEFDADLIGAIDALKNSFDDKMDKILVNKALEDVFALISAANKYIDLTKPWVLNKEGETEKLKSVIYNLLEVIRITSTYLLPFITQKPHKVFKALGLSTPQNFDLAVYGSHKSYQTSDIEVLFPRLDVKKEMQELEKIKIATEKNDNASKNATEKNDNASKNENNTNKADNMNTITIDKFFETQLKVATVTACEKVEKADKLLKLTLDVGGEVRTVVSGIAKSYSPEQMIGKQVVLVANLASAKLRGIESQGMILCASYGDKVVLVSPEQLVESGAEVR